MTAMRCTVLMVGMVALVASGCTEAGPKAKPVVAKAQTKAAAHDHSGWWCDEHGIPESECSMCSSKVARQCKANGDWCDKHDRAKSQCFLCDPSLEAKFAAHYEAKYGKKPPVPEDNRPKNEGK